MTIVDSSPFFNPANNSWIYLCRDEAGQHWVRSTMGNWAKVEPPVSTGEIRADFDDYASTHQPASLDQVKSDNKADDAVDPGDGPDAAIGVVVTAPSL